MSQQDMGSVAPDQPDGIDWQSFDLPSADRARQRVESFLERYGDGRVVTDAEDNDVPMPPLYARDLQVLVNAAWERKQLVWLHAEAVWKVEHLSGWQDIDRMSLEQVLEERDRAEASRRDWAAEAGYLRRELEFELRGINVEMEDVFIHVGDRVEFTRPDGRIARGEVVDLDPIRVMADDTGNTTRWPSELRKAPPCSCLTADGAAVVLAGGFSLPLCAVHPEADR